MLCYSLQNTYARKTIAVALFLLVVPALVPAQEKIDLNMMHKIKTEAFNNSKVMETMHNLTDRYGPRLTNSQQFRAAGNWATKQMKEWGLSKVNLEEWDAGFPGWQYDIFNAAMVEPTYQPLIGVPVAWTAGTNGPVTGIRDPGVDPDSRGHRKVAWQAGGQDRADRDAARSDLPHHSAGAAIYAR